MSVFRGPPASWYDPPEPPGPCCAEGEDDPDHDVEACLAESAEAAAEAKAERMREGAMWDEPPCGDPRPDPRAHPEFWRE